MESYTILMRWLDTPSEDDRWFTTRDGRMVEWSKEVWKENVDKLFSKVYTKQSCVCFTNGFPSCQDTTAHDDPDDPGYIPAMWTNTNNYWHLLRDEVNFHLAL